MKMIGWKNVAFVIILPILMICTSSCSPTGTLRAETLTDDCKFIKSEIGRTTPMECFINNKYNEIYVNSCNEERAQMRKHSVHELEWWEIF